MYPHRFSMKATIFIVTLGFLGSILLSTSNSNVTAAQAYFPPREGNTGNLSNIHTGKLLSANNSAPDAASVIDVRVSAGANDAEERISDGYMYLNSTDLELVYDPGVTLGVQSVGMLFNGISIPKGSTITQAYIEFQVDESSSEATSLVFHGQAADNAAAFATRTRDISNRTRTTASVNWDNIAAWNTVGAKVQSPDLTGIIQEIINRSGWASGNSLAVLVDGSGRRVAAAYEVGATIAPLLHVAYVLAGSTATPLPTSQPPNPTSPPPNPTSPPPPQSVTLNLRISGRDDDAEQRLSDGRMYLSSTDLELIYDPSVTKSNQSVGMRFNNVSIPRGSTIVNAYVELEVDQASREATSLIIKGQAADNASTFSKNRNDITNRARTAASTGWNNIPAWEIVGNKVQSPDLAGVVQEIVNRSGWASGNSLAIIVEGSGRRIAAAYEAGAARAPLLHVVYLPVITTTTPTPPPSPALTATPLPPTATSPAPTATLPAPTVTPSPTSDPLPTPVGQTGTWRMVFNDEFASPNLDTSKWRTCFWWADTTCSIETNNEMELYNPEDVLVQNGMLRLRAQKRDMVAWNGVTYHYTSGMVMTGGRGGQIPPSFSFVYGFAEALVKVPAGQGLWPAFWTLSADYQWPPEIDIMEILGHEPTAYHTNYHYTGGNAGSTWNGPDFSAGWHVLGLEWRADAIIWYVDGVERWRFSDSTKIINEPSYLLLNLAVGGNWPGPPNGSTSFPSYFDIEYVRVWQR